MRTSILLPFALTGPAIAQLRLEDQECVIAADLWSNEPQILSANPGFDGIVGVDPDSKAAVEAAGAAWAEHDCGDTASSTVFTTAVDPAVSLVYFCDEFVDLDDGMPICFSWPVLPSSISQKHLLYKRSDGEQFNPKCISTIPNWEFNERHCLVVFDDFFNRKLPGEEGRLWMEEIKIVGPLMLVGPNGNITSAEGLTWKPESPDATSYVNGAVYLGARLVPLHTIGEGGPPSMVQRLGAFLPNSGVALYGEADNLFRLRLYYSGGMTPDGLSPMQPTMYDDYFRIHFQNGQQISVANEGLAIGDNSTVTVLGLAELGRHQEHGYSACYQEDRDNYLDIILQVVGDSSVLNQIDSVEAFTKEGGKSLYNPGGPGPTPFDGVRYVAPAAPQTIAVNVDLDRIYETTYCVHENGTESTTISTCQLWSVTNELQSIPQGGLPAARRPFSSASSASAFRTSVLIVLAFGLVSLFSN